MITLQNQPFQQLNSINESQIQYNVMNIPKQTQIRCYDHPALDMCVNKKCNQKSIFTCGLFDCKCQKEHKLCIKVNLFNVIDSIQQKKLPVKDFKHIVELTIKKIIDNLSKLRQELLLKVQSKIKQSQLLQIEKKFLQYAHSQQDSESKFTLQDSTYLWEIISQQNQIKSKLFEEFETLLTRLQIETTLSISKLEKQLNGLIQNQQRIRQNQSATLKHKTIQTIISKSSIIKSIQNSQRLINFFPKKLKNMELLYKASDHQFKLSQFFQICGKTTNTVILCESDKGKIVGGYTPFCHYRQNLTQEQTPIKDPLGESFMFSLTNNDKFTISKNGEAISIRRDKNFICFGEGQILIEDKANVSKSCQLCCNYFYNNEEYIKDDINSYIKLNGNETFRCSLNQWQVWKVQTK